jgi:hypothetical protein
MQFKPSGASNYGSDDRFYSAQHMLTTYKSGQDVGDAYGEPVTATIGLLAAAIPALAPAIGGLFGGGKRKAEQEAAMARAEQAEAAAAMALQQAAAARQTTMLVGGGLGVVLLVGLGVGAVVLLRRR